MIFTRAYKEQWSLTNKLSFRFLFSYCVLYAFSGLLNALWNSPIHWIAKNIFSITRDFSSKGYGSGDTTYQYLLIVLLFFIALLSTLIWSIVDAKRASYNNMNYGFLVFLRIVLVYYLLVYGIIKVFHIQMIPPTYSQLIQPLGEMSPMRLAWVFMGFSKGYSMFAGGMEVLAALLLISRRTQTLGAMVAVAVMTQVFIMNLCFDIPVKLFSFHLLAFSCIVLLSDFNRFFSFLFLNKTPKEVSIYPKRNKEATKVIPIVKIAVVSLFIWFFSSTSVSRSERFMERLNPYMAGIWQVNSFKKNTETDISSNDDDKRWKNLVVSYKGAMGIQMMNDSIVYYKTKIDTIAKSIVFSKDSIDSKFDYRLSNEQRLFLRGIINKDTLEIELNRKTKQDFLLTSRGFHWINEYPLNK